MPRPKVWGDFTVNDAFEGTDDAGDDLVVFTCPYNCGKPIRMKAPSSRWTATPSSFIMPNILDHGRAKYARRCLRMLISPR